MDYDEQSIAGGFLAGDPGAHQRVLRWITRVLAAPRFRGLRDEGPDLQQEVLQGVLESLRNGRFNASRDLRTYVQSITHYIGRAALLRRIRSSQLRSSGAATDGITPAVAEDLTIDTQQVRDVMDRIPEPCRVLLTMFYYEQRTYAEIAGALNLPVGTVKSRLFRCVRKAAAQLSRDRRPVRSRPDRKVRPSVARVPE
jgi:RNA polymerase sigma-70 factor, ECF subfamily